MTRLSATEREERAKLRRALAELEKPIREARKAERKARVKARPKRDQRVQHQADPVKASRGRERDPGYLAFLRRLPCVACMVEPRADCGPTEAAHLRFSDASRGRINSGLQVKPSDRWATPLGRWHHQYDQHSGSEKLFWQRLNIDPGELAEALYSSYQNGGDGTQILVQFAEKAKG